jgi:hypothetical protein
MEADRLASAVGTVGGAIGASCLPRALALGRMLASRGVAHVIHLGARRTGRGVAAHAWVSQAGRVLIGGMGHEAYEPLLVFPREPR